MTIMLIFSFVGMAVFGLFMMHGEDHGVCPIAAMQGADCMLISNPLQVAAMHLNAFLALSLATLLALVFAGIALILRIFHRNSLPPDPFQYYQHHAPPVSRFQFLTRHWFSLFEHSPTI